MDDNRLRGFSPPPWAALGRRDPNHEQAPWRESKNVEWRVNPSWAEWGSALVNDDLPSSLPLFRSEPGVTHSAGISVGSSGTYRPETFNQFLASHNMQIRTPNADADRILRAAYDLSVHRPQKSQTPSLSPANVNSRNPEHMKPRLNVIEGGGAPWKPSPEARADGGPVKPQPSFSEPLSGFIDRTVGGMKDYGRSAMTEAGWAPWAKGAGEVAMSVATSPFESVSSASKLAAAPADWATGRQVSASPWDILSALPIAALGGARAAGHISRNRDALRRQDALDSLTGARRERGDLSGTDLRIKQLIDGMASRRNMD